MHCCPQVIADAPYGSPGFQSVKDGLSHYLAALVNRVEEFSVLAPQCAPQLLRIEWRCIVSKKSCKLDLLSSVKTFLRRSL